MRYEKGQIVAAAFWRNDPYGRECVDWRPAVYSKPSADGGHWVYDFPTSFNSLDGMGPECIAYEDIRPASMFWPWLENAFVAYGVE